jgi:alkanesulfonate monooxygenase SsuD/methylene tetrahydromethanopterin reductase-like flavin-dependent oxidoreductase (luciferase family)
MTIDHLTNGRVEVALGVGDPSAGAAAVGLSWSPAEQVARFAEFVQLVDLLLRQEVTTFASAYHRCDAAETIPRPVQQPRPPITVAAHGRKMLRIAAQYADGWSPWGGYEVNTEQDFYAITADRCARFDDLAAGLGRDPHRIRHSIVCFPPLTPWESTEYFADMVGRFRAMGIDEFVLYWPGTWRDEPRGAAVFEKVTNTVIPSLRATAT